MGKLRPREQKQQASGHAAPWWQKQELSPEPAGHAHLGPDSDTPHGLHLMFTLSFLIRCRMPSSDPPGRHLCRWTGSGGGAFKERKRRKRKTFSWASSFGPDAQAMLSSGSILAMVGGVWRLKLTIWGLEVPHTTTK